MATQPPKITSTYSPSDFKRVTAAASAASVSNARYQRDATFARLGAPPPPVPVVPPPDTWGAHMGVNAGPLPSDEAILATKRLGLGIVQCSPERDWLSDAEKKELVLRIHQVGLRAHVCCQEGGAAPSPGPHDYNYPDIAAGSKAFAGYCAAWARAGADILTLLNETQNPDFYRPTPDPTQKIVARICADALGAIRAVSTTVPVYLPGMSPAGGNLAPAVATKALCAELKRLGVLGFTGCGHHPYCYDGPLAWGLPNHKEWNAFLQTPDVWTAARDAGIPGPMSLGEYGCPSAGTEEGTPGTTFTEEIQADVIAQTLEGIQMYRRYGIPVGYVGLSTAIDGDATTRPLESTMGVIRKDGTDKPAAKVVRDWSTKAWAV